MLWSFKKKKAKYLANYDTTDFVFCKSDMLVTGCVN